MVRYHRTWHIDAVRALPCIAALALTAAPARAYERQVTLDLAAGWALAPGLSAPDHGPSSAVGATLGFDDVWGVGVYAGWAVHPPFSGGEALHVGLAGVEGLYYIDILQVVPFFGLGIDVLPTYTRDGGNDLWGADFAAHARFSLDYLVSREVVVGLDVRPYVLFTALSTEPVYLTFFARVSAVLDY